MSPIVKTTSVQRIIPLPIMTRQEIEQWVDQLARKYGELACQYVETYDDKKIVEELYELVRDLEKLKNELIGLETQGLAPGSNPVICSADPRRDRRTNS
jgi:hypothetical protein